MDSNRDQMTAEPQEPQDCAKAAVLERRLRAVRLAFVAAAALSLTACAVLAVLQLHERGEAAGGPTSTVEAASRDGAPATKPTITDGQLSERLPARIDGFRTTARHDVPGFEGQMAEAIYTPLSEEISIRMPLNCYAMLKIAEPKDLAGELIRLVDKHGAGIAESDVPALQGRQVFLYEDRSKHLLMWIQSDYLVMIDARFTIATPAEADGVLEAHVRAAAIAVAEGLPPR